MVLLVLVFVQGSPRFHCCPLGLFLESFCVRDSLGWMGTTSWLLPGSCSLRLRTSGVID